MVNEVLEYIKDKPRYKKIIIHCNNVKEYNHIQKMNGHIVYGITDNYKALS